MGISPSPLPLVLASHRMELLKGSPRKPPRKSKCNSLPTPQGSDLVMFQAAGRSTLLHESPFPGLLNQGMGWDTKSSQSFLLRNSNFTTLLKKAQVELKSLFFLPHLLPLQSTFLKVKAKPDFLSTDWMVELVVIGLGR